MQHYIITVKRNPAQWVLHSRYEGSGWSTRIGSFDSEDGAIECAERLCLQDYDNGVDSHITFDLRTSIEDTY